MKKLKSERDQSDNLQNESSKLEKRNEFLSAMVIGIMIGVIVFSIYKNTVGLFTLIPLYFIYKILN